MKGTCRECGKPARSRRADLCAKHYHRQQRGAPLDDSLYLYTRQGPKCSVAGCQRTPHSRGLCHRHYQRWWKYGDPTAGGSYRDVGPFA